MNQNALDLAPHPSSLSNLLMDSIQEGVLVISEHLTPLYMNQKAKEICGQLWQKSDYLGPLPPIISGIARQHIKQSKHDARTRTIDCQISEQKQLRIRTQPLENLLDYHKQENSEDCSYILLLLEDREATLTENLKIDQEKYDLTDRETEILRLLSQSFSYQEISETLVISLNTVKFHVKNIYSKKRASNSNKEHVFY